MKNIAYLFFLLFFYSGTQAQLHDKIWFTGKWSNVPPDTVFGNVRFTFSDTGVAIKRDSLGMNFDRGSSTISDSAGNLLFYTNGIDIRNANDEIMQNGDSLGKGWQLSYYNQYPYGVRIPQKQTIFPIQQGAKFMMAYLFGDSLYQPFAIFGKLMIARINPYSNGGIVEVKDSVIVEDTLGHCLAATKDSKGGWWFTFPKAVSNCHYICNIDSNGKVGELKLECGGAKTLGGDFMVSAFSKDGNRLVTANTYVSGGYINVYDFDRCTGNINLVESFRLNFIVDSTRFINGMESSPNSRYMYLFADLSIIQLDLAAPSIANSAQTVAYLDTFAGEKAVGFFSGQLGIDGRIYICDGSGTKYVHRINQPDKGGLACEVQQCYHRMPAFILGLPRYPNYRLGAANCTGVGINEAAVSKVRMGLYPNPASTTLQVEYNYINWEQSGSIQLILTDATGRSIHSQALPMYSGLQNIDVSQLAGGVYFVSLSAKERTIANGRFVKE